MVGTPLVVYIAGSGRSGSTILDMMIGGHSRVLSLGQLDQLRQWVETANVCTCSSPLHECSFWSRVFGAEPLSAEAVPPMLNVRGQVNKVIRTLAALVGPNQKRGGDQAAAQTWALLERVAAVGNAAVVVDSSKTALRLARLARDPVRRGQLRVVHLVRDPRGYVASKTIAKPAPSARGFVGLTEAEPRSKAIADWIVQNSLVYLFARARLRGQYEVVTYEKLVNRPIETLSRIAAHVGLSFEPGMLPPKSRDNYHLIGGNSARLSFDELRLDTSWHERLSGRDQRLVWWLCGWLYRFFQRLEVRASHSD